MSGEIGNVVPDRLLDGYDGGDSPPDEYIQKLMQSAPPEIRGRAAEWAKQRAAQGGDQEQQPQADEKAPA